MRLHAALHGGALGVTALPEAMDIRSETWR